ncbi:hypothetical protein [Streptosporangium sandarakinum]|uniref:hypothetical protein n=1 Tax=Streptosporangium sandarakinum TaxID=1260955 RepID=UPI0036874916
MDAGGAGQRIGFQEPAEGLRLHVEPVGHDLGTLPGRQGSGQAHGVGDRVRLEQGVVGQELLGLAGGFGHEVAEQLQ